eukprot:COSAG06_NODE_49426_length_325_cov_1.137168_1_plen_95_part_01
MCNSVVAWQTMYHVPSAPSAGAELPQCGPDKARSVNGPSGFVETRTRGGPDTNRTYCVATPGRFHTTTCGAVPCVIGVAEKSKGPVMVDDVPCTM